MTDRYYVLAGQIRPNGSGTWDVVSRFTFPSGDNAVSVAWTVAAGERYDAVGSPSSAWPGEDSALLDSGVEVEIRFRHKDNVNNSGLQARLEAAVVAAIAGEKARLEGVLQFWGKTAVV
jgi:hypothetical protein